MAVVHFANVIWNLFLQSMNWTERTLITIMIQQIAANFEWGLSKENVASLPPDCSDGTMLKTQCAVTEL